MYKPPNPLLGLLLASPQISGEECARALGITRAGVHKQLEKLRSRGWNISAAPKRGLSLNQPYPFALIPELIAPHIKASLFFAEELSSTNVLAKTLGEKAPFVLMVRNQNQGKGRAGRGWDMQPDKDLAFSYLWQGNLPLSRLFSMIRISALAVQGALEDLGCACAIKWPNDVITSEGRKLCGILCEAVSVENSAHTLILGIGINGNGVNLPGYAQSAAGLLGHSIDINRLAVSVLSRIEGFLADFPQNEDFIIRAWESKLAWLGEPVKFEQSGQSYEGIFKGCGKDGEIILEINGALKHFFAGDLSGVKLRKS